MPFRSYKYELSLNATEERILDNQMRWLVFTYNYFLKYNAKQYKQYKRFISTDVMRNHIPVYRNKYNSIPLLTDDLIVQVISELHQDLNNYIKNPAKKVLYKKPYDTFRMTYKSDFSFDPVGNTVSFGVLNHIGIRFSRSFQGSVRSLEISKKANRWYSTFVLKTNTASKPKKLDRSVGIDVGLKDFAIFSNGTVIENPRYYRQLEEKFRKEQRRLTRKNRFSSNWVKQRTKVQKAYSDLIHFRMNFLHQITSQITDEFDVIGIEKLNILDMAQNKKIRKSILDASWGQFIKLLKYKAEEKGKIVVEVGRYYPSSQLCSRCGSKRIMPLHLRTYQCQSCGLEIDRDYNASINIENKAVEMYHSSKGV